MSKQKKEFLMIGIGLIGLSLVLNYVHYLIFQDLHHTLIFLFADIAFIPMEVFFTTLVIDKLLEKREKEHLRDKLSMLIGVFFSELGTDILNTFVYADDNTEIIAKEALVTKEWNKNEFKNLEKLVDEYEYDIDIKKVDLIALEKKLNAQKDLVINLITNPMLIEHEEFSDMLMSILHLREELSSRCSHELEEYEIKHLAKDINVAYKYLTFEWIQYMKQLKANYPQLFLKALITNPFDKRSLKEKECSYL
ncbi:MAG: hypothetical protein E7H54_07630 [Clostridium perfringens]|nr:hypothetical protein [Clostridium perfringens]MDU8989035.1 hypothetical protein [Clostridium perfringens]